MNWEQTGTLPVPEGIEPFGDFSSYPAWLVESGGRLFLSEARAVEGVLSRPIRAWTSGDGRAWEALDLGTEAEVRSVTGVQGWFLLGGRLGSDGGDATVWRWDAPIAP